MEGEAGSENKDSCVESQVMWIMEALHGSFSCGGETPRGIDTLPFLKIFVYTQFFLNDKYYSVEAPVVIMIRYFLCRAKFNMDCMRRKGHFSSVLNKGFASCNKYKDLYM